MRTIETKSTSRSSAGCNPIVLREGEQVRLVFVPFLVENSDNPKACVDGHFVYQRKAKSGRWLPPQTIPLSSLRSGAEFKLTLHANELLTLLSGLIPLYKFHEQKGVPLGNKTFVQVDKGMAKFISLGQRDLNVLLTSRPNQVADLLLGLVKWLASSEGRREAAERLMAQAPDQVPAIASLVGLAAMKEALQYWKKNQTNDSEEFWQQAIATRSYVLSQLFAYPVVVLATKAYVGGKELTNRGGSEVDFLLAAESTDSVILLELKTPQTQLLGPSYREGVFPLSRDVVSAVAQVLTYRQRLMKSFDTLLADRMSKLTLGEPRCVVIAGNTNELDAVRKRENFELQRDRTRGVMIVTYDELFLRLGKLISFLENPF